MSTQPITIDYRDYLKRVTAIHNEMVQRLADSEQTSPLELASLFEDAANRYMDIAEDIQASLSPFPGPTQIPFPSACPQPPFAPDPAADSED